LFAEWEGGREKRGKKKEEEGKRKIPSLIRINEGKRRIFNG